MPPLYAAGPYRRYAERVQLNGERSMRVSIIWSSQSPSLTAPNQQLRSLGHGGNICYPGREFEVTGALLRLLARLPDHPAKRICEEIGKDFPRRRACSANGTTVIISGRRMAGTDGVPPASADFVDPHSTLGLKPADRATADSLRSSRSRVGSSI